MYSPSLVDIVMNSVFPEDSSLLRISPRVTVLLQKLVLRSMSRPLLLALWPAHDPEPPSGVLRERAQVVDQRG